MLIWKNFLASMPSDVGTVNLSKDELSHLAKQPMNGREVRCYSVDMSWLLYADAIPED
jgi:hypothetical protein